jgi:hypothetical protein
MFDFIQEAVDLIAHYPALRAVGLRHLGFPRAPPADLDIWVLLAEPSKPQHWIRPGIAVRDVQ